jgi:hypothetical protein
MYSVIKLPWIAIIQEGVGGIFMGTKILLVYGDVNSWVSYNTR